jgi:hypothetical protein
MADPVYGDADGFKSYWNDRGQQAAIVAFDDSEINPALLIASGYLDAAFLSQFMGLKTGGRNQIREWPRIGVQDIYGYAIPSDVPPREVINATYEATFRQLQTPGVFFKDYTPSKYRSVSVSGAVSVVYAIGSSAYDVQTQMPALAAILLPILTGMGSGAFSPLSGRVSRV